MTKLQTIIEYAIERGWKAEFDGETLTWQTDAGTYAKPQLDPTEAVGFIFDHDFLKAVFGAGKSETGELAEYEWQEQAMMMVISDDPINYIYSWLKARKDES